LLCQARLKGGSVDGIVAAEVVKSRTMTLMIYSIRHICYD
jgi:hypothetical protein